MKRIGLLFSGTFLSLLFNCNVFAQFIDTLHIDYFGQTPPGKKAVVFAPDFISRKGWWVESCCFSHDGKEFVFTLTDETWKYKVIMYTKYVDGKWTEPDSIIKNSFAPHFSHDDQFLYFISYQRGGSKTADIWKSIRGDNGWQEPVKMGYPVNSDDGEEFEVSETGDGTMYIASNRPGGYGEMDIYRAIVTDGQYKIENPGPPVNTNWVEVCPYIAPDESYMVFNSWKPNPKFKGNNLYITFRNIDGFWTNPKDLGPAVNTDYLDIYPYFSPDGKYFFYTIRTTCCVNGEPSSKIYWVSTGIFDSLNQTNKKCNLKPS
jgi:hypothetical protein